VVNTNGIAHDLLRKMGSVSSLLDADISELEKVKGVGYQTAFFIKVLAEGVRRYRCQYDSREPLTEYDLIGRFLQEQFGGISSDVCCIVTVSPSMEVISTVKLPMGDITEKRLNTRDITEILIKRGTHRMILGLYHPNGKAVPKPSDFAVTMMFSELCAPLQIEFIDSVICGNEGTFSMRSKGAFNFR
jgi:DNA repair protein RadC